LQAAASPTSWADEVDAEEKAKSPEVHKSAPVLPPQADDDDAPPPGFENVKPSQDNADAAAELLANVKVTEENTTTNGVDDPDLSIKQDRLVDDGPGEIKTVTADNTIYSSARSFEELGLSQELLQGLYTEMKFERPSKVQAQTLPMILTPPYKSLIAQAHNGSGKTTCFTLAMLSRVDPRLNAPQALCVCPTRELVVQNLMVLERMGKYTGITSTSTADTAQSTLTRRTRIDDQVIVGTHGKLRDWMSKRVLNTRGIKILVFDEADEMLKQDAFADDTVRMIKTLRHANPDIQILLFSATFNERVKKFATKVVPNANQVFVPKEDLSLDVIKQYRVYCPSQEAKVQVLKDMIFPQCEKLGQTIIFVRTRETARGLHRAMEGEGHKCTSIEGGMEKGARDSVVREFREGTTKILISTDVLSRGFDVTQVTLVINFDVPVERNLREPAFETYLHRIGRSGRFGRKGAAFNLVTGDAEKRVMDEIEAYFRHDIPEVPYDDEDKFLDVLKKAGLTDG
jgi:ATP-dependent RNA helicase DDX19/DBP5